MARREAGSKRVKARPTLRKEEMKRCPNQIEIRQISTNGLLSHSRSLSQNLPAPKRKKKNGLSVCPNLNMLQSAYST